MTDQNSSAPDPPNPYQPAAVDESGDADRNGAIRTDQTWTPTVLTLGFVFGGLVGAVIAISFAVMSSSKSSGGGEVIFGAPFAALLLAFYILSRLVAAPTPSPAVSTFASLLAAVPAYILYVPACSFMTLVLPPRGDPVFAWQLVPYSALAFAVSLWIVAGFLRAWYCKQREDSPPAEADTTQ